MDQGGLQYGSDEEGNVGSVSDQINQDNENGFAFPGESPNHNLFYSRMLGLQRNEPMVIDIATSSQPPRARPEIDTNQLIKTAELQSLSLPRLNPEDILSLWLVFMFFYTNT